MKRIISIFVLLIVSFSVANTQAYFRYAENEKVTYSLFTNQPKVYTLLLVQTKEKTEDKCEIVNFSSTIYNSADIFIIESLEKNLKQAILTDFLEKNEVKDYSEYAELLIERFSKWEDIKLFASLLVAESRGKENAVSKKGAMGPWQIMPFWKKALKVSGSLKNKKVNLECAIKVLNIHKKEAKGNLWGPKGGLYRYSGGASYYPKKISRLYNEIEGFRA